jgi:hypothetical protein
MKFSQLNELCSVKWDNDVKDKLIWMLKKAAIS